MEALARCFPVVEDSAADGEVSGLPLTRSFREAVATRLERASLEPSVSAPVARGFHNLGLTADANRCAQSLSVGSGDVFDLKCHQDARAAVAAIQAVHPAFAEK